MVEISHSEEPKIKRSNNPQTQERVETIIETNPKIQNLPLKQQTDIARDYVARELLVQREREKGQTDILTGLPNRAGFMDRLQQQINRLIRSANPHNEVYVVMIDVNNLKIVNDSKGHTAGDELLKTIANTLKATRNIDTAARLGGDEFAAILETDSDGVKAWCKRISEKLHQAQQIKEQEGEHMEITISAGAARLYPSDPKGSMDDADQLQYLAKGKKGNRESHFFMRDEENKPVEYISSKEIPTPTPFSKSEAA